MKTVWAKNREALDRCGISMPVLGAVTVLGWADNLLFLSRSVAAAQQALDIFTKGFHEMGMRWKASSMQYLHEGAVYPATARTKRWADRILEDDPQPLPEGHQVKRIAQMELLGCLITTDNRAAVQHRLVKAAGAFWKHKAFFLSSVVTWRQKMIEYVKKVRPVALYGSASWQWGADTSAALTTWEGAMLRRMCRVAAGRRRVLRGLRRLTKVARQQPQEAGAEDIASAMLRRQFRWINSNLHRISSDLLGQTRRVHRPQEQSWHHVPASIRDDTLPRVEHAGQGQAQLAQ